MKMDISAMPMLRIRDMSSRVMGVSEEEKAKSEVSMSREGTELLVQKQREENAEANCECSFIQAVQGKTYENQTKQANFISTLFLFFFVLENLFFFFTKTVFSRAKSFITL